MLTTVLNRTIISGHALCNGGMKNRNNKRAACANRKPFQPLHKFISSPGRKIRYFRHNTWYSLRNWTAWAAVHPKRALRNLVFKQADSQFLYKAAFWKRIYRNEIFFKWLSRKASFSYSKGKRALRPLRKAYLFRRMRSFCQVFLWRTPSAYCSYKKACRFPRKWIQKNFGE